MSYSLASDGGSWTTLQLSISPCLLTLPRLRLTGFTVSSAAATVSTVSSAISSSTNSAAVDRVPALLFPSLACFPENCRRFRYAELEDATRMDVSLNGFDSRLVIGEGGFGKVCTLSFNSLVIRSRRNAGHGSGHGTEGHGSASALHVCPTLGEHKTHDAAATPSNRRADGTLASVSARGTTYKVSASKDRRFLKLCLSCEIWV